MTAPTLKLQDGAPLRLPTTRPASSPAARLAPGADVRRLGRAPHAGPRAASTPQALCSGPERPAAPAPGAAPVAADAPPPPPSGELGFEPAAAGEAQCEPAAAGEAQCEHAAPAPSAPPDAGVEPPPEVEPHRLAAFAVALETIDAPAFLTKPGGEIAYANGVARAWFERDRPGAAAGLDEARRASKSHAFSSAPVLAAAGAEPWRLVVARPDGDREAERLARVAAASARWSLSARQREVLLLVVEGLSVPTIAAVLGCVEKTVGSHLNAIFKKALVESRAELTARVWMG